MFEHAAVESSVNTVTAGPRSKGRALKSARKRTIVALATAVVFVGGVTACSSPTSTSTPEPQASASEATGIPAEVISTPEPQASASEATGIPAEVISAYMEAWCVGMGTYEAATVTCSIEDEPVTWEGVNALFATQGWPSLLLDQYQYTELGVSDDYRDCPSEADLRASLATVEVDPPAISDECLTTVLIQSTKVLKDWQD
jgi:hypothetical protein